MSWLDTLLAGNVKRICLLCSSDLKPNPYEDLRGDKRLVPDLSPTCPLTPAKAPCTFTPGAGGQAPQPICPLVLSPIKSAPSLDLRAEGTKGTQGTNPEQTSQLWDQTLEARCAGADPEEARYLREERAGILEFEAGMSWKEAAALACTRDPPAILENKNLLNCSPLTDQRKTHHDSHARRNQIPDRCQSR